MNYYLSTVNVTDKLINRFGVLNNIIYLHRFIFITPEIPLRIYSYNVAYINARVRYYRCTVIIRFLSLRSSICL